MEGAFAMIRILKRIRLFITSNSGDGVISSLIWVAVTAIVSATIAYTIWDAMSGSAGLVKDIITTTIH